MPNKTPPGMMIYAEMYDVFRLLPLDTVGCIVMGMFFYFTTGTEPELPAEVAFLWPMLKSKLDHNNKEYKKKITNNKLKALYSHYKRKAVTNDEEPLSYEDWIESRSDITSGNEFDTSVEDDVRDARIGKRDACNSMPTKHSPTNPNSSNNKAEPSEAKANPSAGTAVATPMQVPPTLEEVQSFCQSNEINISPEAFYYHYSSVGWKVGKTPITDWMAVARKWAHNESSQPPSSPDRGENKNNRPTRDDLERLKKLHNKIRGSEEKEEPTPE